MLKFVPLINIFTTAHVKWLQNSRRIFLFAAVKANTARVITPVTLATNQQGQFNTVYLNRFTTGFYWRFRGLRHV